MAVTSSALGSLWYDLKKYYGFSKEEVNAVLIGVIVTAIVISFDEWGVDSFDMSYGLRNLFNAFLIVLLSFLVHISAQRLIGLWSGFKVEYRIWLYGLGIAVILAVVSRGKLWFLAPGGIIVYHMTGHRLGSFRYGLNFWPLGITAVTGPLASALLAVLFKLLLYVSPGNVLLMKGMVFNVWYAMLTMLPIPPLDGSHMFFASRLTYIFAYGWLIGLCVSLLFPISVFISLGLGLLMGIALWLASYIFFESG